MIIRLNPKRRIAGWTTLLTVGKQIATQKVADIAKNKLGGLKEGAGLVGGLVSGGGGTTPTDPSLGGMDNLVTGPGIAQQEMGKSVGLLGGVKSEDSAAVDPAFMEQQMAGLETMPAASINTGQDQGKALANWLLQMQTGEGMQSPDMAQFDWRQLWM